MTRIGLALIFIAGFAVALAGTMPISVALTWSGARAAGLSARNITGSIWDGRLQATQFRRVPLGDAEASLDLFAIFTGLARLSLQSERGTLTLVEGRARGLDGADIAIDVQQLGFGVPMTGSVRLQNTTLLFENGRCSKAQGRIVTDAARQSWGGPELAGEFSCAGTAAIARLRGARDDVEVAMDIGVEANGRYRLHSQVTSSNPAILSALSLAGFVMSGGGMMRIDEGLFGS